MTSKWGTRETLIAPPGHCVVSWDYDAFEMRTWSQCCYWLFKYSDLREVLNDPKRCAHVEMGARLKKIAVEAAYALKKTDKDAYKALRGVAKGPNFGLPGGMGPERLIDYCWNNYGVEVTIEEAIVAREVWLAIYREAGPYLEWVKDQVGRKRGSTGTITQFYSKRLRGRVGYTEAANGFFQALAADIAKEAGWRLMEHAYEKKNSPLYGCRPLGFVHDEYLYAIPYADKHRFHEAAYLGAKIMADTAMEICPDLLFTVSPAAMFRWTKAAGDPLHDSAGLLVPYEVACDLEVPKNQGGAFQW